MQGEHGEHGEGAESGGQAAHELIRHVHSKDRFLEYAPDFETPITVLSVSMVEAVRESLAGETGRGR
ncbi:hypothetical protein GCM10028771_05380 [Nocardioides marmoraquaticus]